MTTDQLITLIVALGGGVFLREAGVGIYHWATGGQARERSALRQAMTDLDAESAYRRRVTEHAHEVRRIAIDHGIPSDALPPFPTRTPSPQPEESS